MIQLKKRLRDCTVGLLALAIPAVSTFAQSAPETSFRVFLSGRSIGNEQVLVVESDRGRTISGTGRLEAPVDLATRWFEVRYDAEGRPLELTMDAVLRSEALKNLLTIEQGTATVTITKGTETSTLSHPISERTTLLSDSFFAPYEVLASQLARASVGEEMPVYFVGQGEIAVRLERALDERIRTPERTIQARRHQIVFLRPGVPFRGEVWSDERGRLLRVSLPTAAIEVLREDIATVNARRETLSRTGDEEVRVPASGFSLAATLSRPTGDKPRSGFPAIVLVPGSTAGDRDESIDGFPVYGQLAGALADAGFFVVRYDRRGTAQSGGRSESAGVGDYADDARWAVEYLRDREDVDEKRIGVLGLGDGGSVALMAASREDKIGTVILIGTPGSPGAELVLEQQRRTLEASGFSPEEREAKIEIQKRIHEAVLTGQGWDGIPPELRRQAETTWFRSFLAFDPADAIRRTRQPLLILQGELDRQVPPHHADRLAELGRQRRREARTEVVKVPGVDHRLVAAGGASNAPPADGPVLAPAVVEAISTWLGSL